MLKVLHWCQKRTFNFKSEQNGSFKNGSLEDDGGFLIKFLHFYCFYFWNTLFGIFLFLMMGLFKYNFFCIRNHKGFKRGFYQHCHRRNTLGSAKDFSIKISETSPFFLVWRTSKEPYSTIKHLLSNGKLRVLRGTKDGFTPGKKSTNI